MRVWIDLSNSPHVELFGPVVEHLAGHGDEVLLTVRDHAQTLELARRRWPDVTVVGGSSPPGRTAKATAIAGRTAALARFAAGRRADVALSHGSYAQVAAARLLRLPALTMMDYEFQPANHLSFRLADRVLVPRAFPAEALRRFGAVRKTLVYDGYKEELYLAGFEPDPAVLGSLGLDPARVIVVLRPPPDGALYHREQNVRFVEEAQRVVARPEVQAVLLARAADRAHWEELLPGVVAPAVAVDGPSLVALADLTIGAGGTMNRESALLGTPTYTVFAGRLAAVDAELIRQGRLTDLRPSGAQARIEKRPAGSRGSVARERRDVVLEALDRALGELSSGARRQPRASVPALRPRLRPARRRV